MQTTAPNNRERATRGASRMAARALATSVIAVSLVLASAQRSALHAQDFNVNSTPTDSRSWLLCGGSYVGWSGPGFCGAVTLDVLSRSTTALVTMTVQNLSGLFRSYAGSVLTGIGLTNIFARTPPLLNTAGNCAPSGVDCASLWVLATSGTSTNMPNGIGLVNMKFYTRNLPGGIASNCAATVDQLDASGHPVTVPTNPSGLFVTDCNGNSGVTYKFWTMGPVNLSAVEVSLRGQHGYPDNRASTACTYPASDTRTAAACALTSRTPTAVTPEPASMILLATGLLGLALAKRRQRNANTDAC